MFYSGNNFDTAQYAISYATAPAVGGPYTKRGPWLASSAVYGSVSCWVSKGLQRCRAV